MIRVKLPMGGVTPEQMDAFADVIEKYAPLEQGPHHDPPEHPDPPRPAARRREADPRDLRRRPLLARGLRQHGPQRHRRPVRRRHRGRALRHHPLRGGLRPLLRPPPDDAADAAQDQDRVHRHRRGRRDHRHPRHRLHPARCATASAGVEIRVGGGTSIMPRIAPTLYEFVELDNGDYLKVTEAVLADLRPPGLAARQPRPRPDQGAGRQDRHRRLPRDGRGGARGRLGRRARLLDRPPAATSSTRRRTRPGPPATPASPNGDRSRVRALPRRRTSRPQRQEGFSTVDVKVTRGDLTPEQFRGLGQIMREYTGGYARTTVQQNFVLRWVRDEAVYDVWQRLGELGLGRRRRRRDHRRRLLPRHRLLQARDHQLDGPEPGDPGADRVDGDHRSADQAGPHQDVRLPERLQPAPHREHRLLRRLDQGRRPHDARLHPPPRRQLRGRRGRLRPPAEGRGCPPSAFPTRSSAGCASTRPSATTARRSTTSSSGSAPSASRTRSRSSRCRPSSTSRR